MEWVLALLRSNICWSNPLGTPHPAISWLQSGPRRGCWDSCACPPPPCNGSRPVLCNLPFPLLPLSLPASHAGCIPRWEREGKAVRWGLLSPSLSKKKSNQGRTPQKKIERAHLKCTSFSLSLPNFLFGGFGMAATWSRVRSTKAQLAKLELSNLIFSLRSLILHRAVIF